MKLSPAQIESLDNLRRVSPHTRTSYLLKANIRTLYVLEKLGLVERRESSYGVFKPSHDIYWGIKKGEQE